jgi:hypothetical protein
MVDTVSEAAAKTNKESAERLQKAQEEAREQAEKDVDSRLEAKNKTVEDQAARHENVQPTPTQRENDLARVGVPTDEKEHDGSESDAEMQRRVMESRLPGGSPYADRSMQADLKSSGEGDNDKPRPRRGSKKS